MFRIVLWGSLFSILFSGCATMFASRTDTITIKTEPPEAEVYEGIELLGTTPFTHTFKRNTFEQKRLSIRKAGFKTRELDLGRSLEPISLFNFGYFLTTWGATSWGIDALSGAMIKYSPTSYFIDLEPESKEPVSMDMDRRERIHFALINYRSLRNDIAMGDGDYLSAYYRVLKSPEPYDDFLRRIQGHAAELLAQEDGAELYQYMETHMP